MNAEATALEAATIRQQCKVLRMPAIAAQCAQLAEQAVRERRRSPPCGYGRQRRTPREGASRPRRWRCYNRDA